MFNLLDKENSDAWNCLSAIEQDKNLVQSIARLSSRTLQMPTSDRISGRSE